MSTIAENFITYLKEQDAYEQLPEIIQELQKEAYRNQDISVISAVPLAQKEEDNLKEMLHKKWGEHRIIITVDPILLSGLIIKFQDYVIDTSGRSKLNQLAQEL